MIHKCTNAYYFAFLNKIGGIESHLFYVAQKYGKWDVCVFYKTGDPKQVARLKKYVKVVQIQYGDRIECENMFCCFNRDVLDITTAKKKYIVLHGDYKTMMENGQLGRENLPIDNRVDGYLGVSQTVCDAWKEITGFDAKNVYEPIVLPKREKCLMLLSATRLSKEKGWERMQKLAAELDRNNVNYLWYIYTDQKKAPSPNMVFCEPRLDMVDKMDGFDAYIQLSDNEGFCLSIVEALMKGVPVICTDLPVVKELGLNESNSIILPFDMKNIPIEEIKNIRRKKFKYEPPKDKWDEVLTHTKSNYRNEMVTVMATDEYRKNNIIDRETQSVIEQGQVMDISIERYRELLEFRKKTGINLVEKI